MRLSDSAKTRRTLSAAGTWRRASRISYDPPETSTSIPIILTRTTGVTIQPSGNLGVQPSFVTTIVGTTGRHSSGTTLGSRLRELRTSGLAPGRSVGFALASGQRVSPLVGGSEPHPWSASRFVRESCYKYSSSSARDEAEPGHCIGSHFVHSRRYSITSLSNIGRNSAGRRKRYCRCCIFPCCGSSDCLATEPQRKQSPGNP